MCYSRICFSLALCLAFQIAQGEPFTLKASEYPLSQVDYDFVLPDGAAWDGQSRLFVPDVKAKTLVALNLSKMNVIREDMLKEPLAISGTCYQLGKLYLSDNGNSRIAIREDSGEIRTIAKFDDRERPNDLTVDSNGNVFVTVTREGKVAKVDPNGKVTTLVEGLDAPNGIAISPDERMLYVSSVKTGLISSVDLSLGDAVSKPEDFAQLEATEDGFRGDGMCVDRAGNLYCTGAKAVSIFRPDGSLIEKIETPERPINVILAGNDRKLFISTFGGLYSKQLNAYGVSPVQPLDRLKRDLGKDQGRAGQIRIDRNVVYANIDGRKLRMDLFYSPTQQRIRKPAIVLVHGGGWLKGDKSKFHRLAMRMTLCGYTVAAIEYRLGYEAKFPAGIQDCNAATAFLRKHAEKYFVDEDSIAAVGGSAGGHLVGLMGAGNSNKSLHHVGQSDPKSARLQAVVVMAGPLQMTTGSVAEKSLSDRDNSNAVAWIGGDINEKKDVYWLADAFEQIDESMPPTLFLVGSQDNPERNEPSRTKMKELSVVAEVIVHEGAKHGHWNRSDWIDTVSQDIDNFLKSCL